MINWDAVIVAIIVYVAVFLLFILSTILILGIEWVHTWVLDFFHGEEEWTSSS